MEYSGIYEMFTEEKIFTLITGTDQYWSETTGHSGSRHIVIRTGVGRASLNIHIYRRGVSVDILLKDKYLILHQTFFVSCLNN